MQNFHVFSDVNECLHPDACGRNAQCQNTIGNYTCSCREGFVGNPFVQVIHANFAIRSKFVKKIVDTVAA